MAFSTKIDDPAFARFKTTSQKWAKGFSAVMAVAAVVGFPLYGAITGELEMPGSLYYGLALGGMFVVIALVQIARQRSDTTWDGAVVSKRVYKGKTKDDDTGAYSKSTVYEMVVQSDDGRLHKHSFANNPLIYNYFKVGDRVRHHKGFSPYEKFDKSEDTNIFCIACYEPNSMANDICTRCKCPLLK